MLAAKPTDNLVVSPSSIVFALAMTSAGAKGSTLAAMDSTLHIADPATIAHSMNGLATSLTKVNKTKDNTKEGGTGTSSVVLQTVNSLWGQAGLTFEQAFLNELWAEYLAPLYTVDYRTDPEAARVAINGWVDGSTHDRIPELLPKGTITTDSRLTLVNAIYLKANWMDEFAVAKTSKAAFTTAAGNSVQVDMMHRSGEMSYAKGDGWQAVDLPYVFGDLSFTVAVGDATSSAVPDGPTVVAALSPGRLVDLGLPKFDIGTTTMLADLLRAMGMAEAFSAQADFSGMTTQEKLFISDVVHQANITVDEKGTEAAAATAVVMAGTAAPVGPPVQLTFDRPFTFWLRDTATGAIVFMGRVADPSKPRTA
jgi:serpin B